MNYLFEYLQQFNEINNVITLVLQEEKYGHRNKPPEN